MVCNDRKNGPVIVKEGQQGWGHCLIFEKWTNASRTAYIGFELCSDAVCHGLTRREIPYPYYYKRNCWEPMRSTAIVAKPDC